MGNLVLRDGRVIELTPEQSEKLGMVILLTTNMDKGVKVGTHSFKLSDILTDRKEIVKVTQQRMFDIPAKRADTRNLS